MKKLISTLLVIMGVQAFVMTANAKIFNGFKRKPASVVSTESGSVTRYVETEHAFKIMIGKHAAFYTFPKDQNAAELKALLDNSNKTKKSLKFTFDAATLEVISIEIL